jgi:hypothetical protein
MIMILEESPQRNKLIYSHVMLNQLEALRLLKSKMILKDIRALFRFKRELSGKLFLL